jgi:hypothetical protein
MVVDGTSTDGEKFPCQIYPAPGFRLGFLAHVRSVPKFFAFGRGAARRVPFARVSRVSFCFVVPVHCGYRNVVQLQNMLV